MRFTVDWALSRELKVATNLLNSFTNGSPKSPPCAICPASDVANSPNLGSSLIKSDLRRSVEIAQFAFPKNMMARWAQLERTWGEIRAPDALASSAMSNIFTNGPVMSRSLSWHARQDRSIPFLGSLMYFVRKVAIRASISGVWATLPSNDGRGHSALRRERTS